MINYGTGRQDVNGGSRIVCHSGQIMEETQLCTQVQQRKQQKL
jgi:hypothetical protein